MVEYVSPFHTEEKNLIRMNRRLALVVIAIACFGLAGGCKKSKRRAQKRATAAAAPASAIRMGSAAFERQLVSGFHGIEANAWRWTAKSFAVALVPPPGAAKKGVVLEVRLTVPPVIITKVGTITLAASINGKALPTEAFATPGDYLYKRDIHPALITGNPVRVEFQLDKAMPPNDIDRRELGIVVSSIGLSAK